MDAYTNYGTSRRTAPAKIRASNNKVALPSILQEHDINAVNLRANNDSEMTGGRVKNPGGDSKHPRLSRDPTWYEGRGRDKATKILSSVGDGVNKVLDIGEKIGSLAKAIPPV